MTPRRAPIRRRGPKPIQCYANGSSVRNDRSPSQTILPRSRSSRHPCKPNALRYKDARCVTVGLRAAARRIHNPRSRASRPAIPISCRKYCKKPSGGAPRPEPGVAPGESCDFRRRDFSQRRFPFLFPRAPVRARSALRHAPPVALFPAPGVPPPTAVAPGAPLPHPVPHRFVAFGRNKVASEQPSPGEENAYSCRLRQAFRFIIRRKTANAENLTGSATAVTPRE